MDKTDTLVDVHDAIVVGVDGSPAGTQALEWAAAQATLEHRRLVLVHASGALGTAGTTWLDTADPETSKPLQAMAEHGAGLNAAAADRIRGQHPDLTIDSLVVTEDAGPELSRLAQDAHLVVVGSRGQGLVRHFPTFQVGSRISRRASCPVVVVPTYDTQISRRGVLVGADLSDTAAPVLRYAYKLASQHDLPLTVLHVSRDSELARVAARQLLSESASGLAEEFPDVEVHLDVTGGWPAKRLLDAAKEMHVLVIGQHHHLGQYEPPIGHVRTHIVDRVQCPVVVVPQVTEPTSH